MITDVAPQLKRAMKISIMGAQSGSFGIPVMAATLSGAPGFYLVLWGVANGVWWEALVAIAGCVLMMIGGLAGFCIAGMLYDRWRGVPSFNRKVMVEARAEGLDIAGYRLIPWHEITGYEGVPDSDSHLVVHAGAVRLLLDDDQESLATVIGWHMQKSR